MSKQNQDGSIHRRLIIFSDKLKILSAYFYFLCDSFNGIVSSEEVRDCISTSTISGARLSTEHLFERLKELEEDLKVIVEHALAEIIAPPHPSLMIYGVK